MFEYKLFYSKIIRICKLTLPKLGYQTCGFYKAMAFQYILYKKKKIKNKMKHSKHKTKIQIH